MISKLEDMCHDLNFNKIDAVDLIKQVNINQEFESVKFCFSHPTTLLAEAIENYNIQMLSLLLENGADPNQIYASEESELWNLQYNNGETEAENEIRLKMAQMLLEYGANPNMNPSNEHEDLFEWVWYEVCNNPYSDSWKYMSRFFILLIAYGGKTKNWSPKILKAFDKSNMGKYRFWLLKEKTDDYCAKIVDDKDNIIALI